MLTRASRQPRARNGETTFAIRYGGPLLLSGSLLLRIGRRRKEFLEELQRLETDDRFAEMLDLPRLRAALEEGPEMTEIDPQKYGAREFAVPRGLLTARFINYVEGRNDV